MQPGASIVFGHQVCRSFPPPAADADANRVVGLDVADILRCLAVIGHQPELVADRPAADRCLAGLAAGAAGRLQEYLRWQASGDWVRDARVERLDEASLALLSAGGHAPIFAKTAGLVKDDMVRCMSQRTHTGRRRNEAARQAILRAAADLLSAGQGEVIAVTAIAERAGVGRQTIYRWWPSKSAVLLEAMVHRAEEVAPVPDSGDLQADMRMFLQTTFAAAAEHRAQLLGVLREALGDTQTQTQLAAFTASRRAALGQILDRAHERGQIPDTTRVAVVVDQAFGVLWYRVIFAHATLDARAATELADALIIQLGNA